MLGSGEGPIAPLPYSVKATAKGLAVSSSASRRVVADDLDSVTDTWATDLSIGAATTTGGKGETAAAATALERGAASADALTLSLAFAYDKGGSKAMTARLARGSPYVTVEFSGGALPFVTSVWPIQSFAAVDDASGDGAGDGGGQEGADATCAGNAGCAAVGLREGDCSKVGK